MNMCVTAGAAFPSLAKKRRGSKKADFWTLKLRSPCCIVPSHLLSVVFTTYNHG